MRYTLIGFKQQDAIELGLDVTDLILLDYIQRANGTPDMKHVIVDDVSYVWLSHKKIHEDLPILDISEGTLKNRLLNLKKKGMIMSTSVKLHTGTMSYYSLTVDATSLTNDVPRQENEIAGHSEVTCPRHSEVTSNNTLDTYNKLENISINTNIKSNPIQSKDIDNFVNDYNEICKSLPKCAKVTNSRRKSIAKILKKYSNEDILQVFNKAEASDFCTGRNDRGWKADIDFILRENKFVSILEGKYDNNKPSGTFNGGKDIFSEYGHVHTGGTRGELVNEQF